MRESYGARGAMEKGRAGGRVFSGSFSAHEDET